MFAGFNYAQSGSYRDALPLRLLRASAASVKRQCRLLSFYLVGFVFCLDPFTQLAQILLSSRRLRH